MTTKKPSLRDEEIGRRIRMRRLALGMSQAALGEKLRLTFQQIQKYEKGLNRIGSGRLEELAQALDVPIGFFFDEKKFEGDVHPILELADTMQAMRLLKAFSEIKSAETRQTLVNLVIQIAAGEKKVSLS